jgi:HEPN domain-containing protein
MARLLLTRDDFRALSGVRLREARELLRRGHFSGAYYLAGYAVECALKACIARRTRRHDFPDKETVQQSYTHNLSQLIRVAELEADLLREGSRNPGLAVNWNIVKDWTESSRYEQKGRAEATDLISAVSSRNAGVLSWLRGRW